eukprot:COSAG01_NODE_14987_length_1388_cov_1.442203_2_plen_47_part_01
MHAVSSRSLVRGLLRGQSGAVIAYGTTGTGKTHTVFGDGNGVAAASA